MAARSSRYGDDAETSRRPAKRASGPPILPILAIVLLIGAAVYVGSAVKKSQAKETQAVANSAGDAPQPFASVPDEAPPDLSERGTRTGVRADEALLQNPDFQAAKALAEEGYALVELSKAAEKIGHVEEYQRKAGEAHEKFQQAVEMTAVWEEQLVETHGDGDPVVKSIRKTRDRWFAQMRKLRAQAK